MLQREDSKGIRVSWGTPGRLSGVRCIDVRSELEAPCSVVQPSDVFPTVMSHNKSSGHSSKAPHLQPLDDLDFKIGNEALWGSKSSICSPLKHGMVMLLPLHCKDRQHLRVRLRFVHPLLLSLMSSFPSRR